MKLSDYRKYSDKANDWIETFFKERESLPVRAQTQPGEIIARLAKSPPQDGHSMDEILEDFAKIVPDGITHWQHPRFFAYFSSNATPASLIADQLANALGAQAMLWQTSPAATEMETVMVDWLRQALGLPDGFCGTIQDSASTATLCAVLTMRERSQNFEGNTIGYAGATPARIYCSEQVHSSVDKACWIAGIGQNNLVKIETDANYQMRPVKLQDAIDKDRAAGLNPAGLILCTGGTSIGAYDDIPPLMEIATKEGLYTHLDAAWAGSAMICPEYRELWAGAEHCDSIVFNPHKWLGAQFDCSVQFLKDPTAQIKTLGIKPSYLHTKGKDDIINYSEWTIPLGRRFRALKLWFLMRAYGLSGLQERIRNHINWTQELAEKFRADPDFEVITEPRFSLFSIRYCADHDHADRLTETLLEKVNDDGRIYLTQTHHQGKYVIRVTIGSFETQHSDVMMVYDVLKELSAGLG